MGTRRTIAPEFFRHEELYDAEVASALPLRLAWCGLWTVADRLGHFLWEPTRIKAEILPFDTVDFPAVLEALVRYQFVRHRDFHGVLHGQVGRLKDWPTFSCDAGIRISTHVPRGKRRRVPLHVKHYVFQRDGARCQACDFVPQNAIEADLLHLDHVVPLARGGESIDAANLQLLCRSCNCRKHTKTMQDFLRGLA